MNPGNWFWSLLRQLLVDALFKRPLELHVKRGADGTLDIKTNLNASGQTPQQTHVYYGGHPGPYGPTAGWPLQVQPPNTVLPPATTPTPQPPAAQPPPPPSIPDASRIDIPSRFES